MLDLDSIEFDNDIPVALIELKHSNVQEINLETDSQIKKIRNLARAAKLPAFICVYWYFHNNTILSAKDDQEITHVQYLLVPLNEHAKRYEAIPIEMSEKDYVSFLYRLRNKPLPNDLKLYNDWKPRVCPPIIGEL